MATAKAYAYGGHTVVPGWLHATSAKVIYELGRHQLDEGIRGAVGEIGVHHGRLFLLLDLLRREDERAFAVDVFDAQHLNPGRSGGANLAAFLHTVERFRGSHAHVEVFGRSSADVAAEEILGAVGPVRLFSVDGDHSAELTESDLRLADATVSEEGIVLVDDVFNESWPGVMTGFSRYLSSGRLVPFGITPNKVLLSTAANANRYREVLDGLRVHGQILRGDLFDRPVAILQPHPSTPRERVAGPYRRAARAVPVLGRLRRALRR